jgi:hypothetical protein
VAVAVAAAAAAAVEAAGVAKHLSLWWSVYRAATYHAGPLPLSSSSPWSWSWSLVCVGVCVEALLWHRSSCTGL